MRHEELRDVISRRGKIDDRRRKIIARALEMTKLYHKVVVPYPIEEEMPDLGVEYKTRHWVGLESLLIRLDYRVVYSGLDSVTTWTLSIEKLVNWDDLLDVVFAIEVGGEWTLPDPNDPDCFLLIDEPGGWEQLLFAKSADEVRVLRRNV